jgi:molybdenum cofactor cytidylyltransferase
MEKHTASGKGMIASLYSEIRGTPVLFDSRYFKELSVLSGDTGAKHLLKRYPDDVATVPFPKGSIDIDTEKDFTLLADQSHR